MKSSNITEDIAKEIESDYTSNFLEEESNTIQEGNGSFLGESNNKPLKYSLNNEKTTDCNSESGKRLVQTKSIRSKSNASSVLNHDSSSNVSSISNQHVSSKIPTFNR